MAGIYIHIPFCRQACTYCNFHFSTSLALKDQLLCAIINEINLTEVFITDEIIHSIYFGGGTPSLLSIDEIKDILQALHSKFKIDVHAEVTFEANPDNINPSILLQWKEAGINRLSVGIQSFVEEELTWMNRAHNASESLTCIDDIIAAGFTNFSVDLIYGSPLLSNEALVKNAQILFSKKIPHISCYALTVEPKTALYAMISQKRSLPVESDKQSTQFLLLMDMMRNEGYVHYEISNFCKPGYQSRHNSSYWAGSAYYGFGPSAHSFNGKNIRRWNIANNALYIRSIDNSVIPFTEEILTRVQQLNELIMISLRTNKGIDLLKVQSNFGDHYADAIRKQSKKYINRRTIEESDNHLILTNEGKLLADGIAADLFFTDEIA